MFKIFHTIFRIAKENSDDIKLITEQIVRNLSYKQIQELIEEVKGHPDATNWHKNLSESLLNKHISEKI